jgi:hypothetical protein
MGHLGHNPAVSCRKVQHLRRPGLLEVRSEQCTEFGWGQQCTKFGRGGNRLGWAANKMKTLPDCMGKEVQHRASEPLLQ